MVACCDRLISSAWRRVAVMGGRGSSSVIASAPSLVASDEVARTASAGFDTAIRAAMADVGGIAVEGTVFAGLRERDLSRLALMRCCASSKTVHHFRVSFVVLDVRLQAYSV